MTRPVVDLWSMFLRQTLWKNAVEKAMHALCEIFGIRPLLQLFPVKNRLNTVKTVILGCFDTRFEVHRVYSPECMQRWPKLFV